MKDGYEGYFEFRNWDRRASEEDFWYYDALNIKSPIAPNSEILEVGFGDARFLDWCKHRDFRVLGVEIMGAAIRKAEALGHEVILGPFSSSSLCPSRSFDLVVAFDVLEHLSVQEIRELFRDTLPHLRSGGRYLFRFPNGDSPFVGPIQAADLTHRTLISPGAMKEICSSFGLVVESVFNDRLLPDGFIRNIKRRCSYMMRSIIEVVVGFAYFGKPRPLDPNVFVSIRRSVIDH